MKRKNKYWFYITVYECPVCGMQEIYREKKITPRPEAYQHRHSFIQKYNYCNR